MNGFPKIFKVKADGLSGVQALWSNEVMGQDFQTISLSIPPEFEGPGGTYSPEDLYALSLVNCYLATFKFVAEKSKLQYESIHAEATLFVDKGTEKAPWMEKILMKFTLLGVQQEDRARNLMEKTKSNCMILNSVKTHIDFEFNVVSI